LPNPTLGLYSSDAHDPDSYLENNHKNSQLVPILLGHYVERGVGELDLEKLPQLIELKYHSIRDVVNELGEVKNIRDVFVGFQRDLY
tara:strand:+ start:6074 stop:6334 length:261 start_codon:yes stop_codon:yes gene_type:complete